MEKFFQHPSRSMVSLLFALSCTYGTIQQALAEESDGSPVYSEIIQPVDVNRFQFEDGMMKEIESVYGKEIVQKIVLDAIKVSAFFPISESLMVESADLGDEVFGNNYIREIIQLDINKFVRAGWTATALRGAFIHEYVHTMRSPGRYRIPQESQVRTERGIPVLYFENSNLYWQLVDAPVSDPDAEYVNEVLTEYHALEMMKAIGFTDEEVLEYHQHSRTYGRGLQLFHLLGVSPSTNRLEYLRRIKERYTWPRAVLEGDDIDFILDVVNQVRDNRLSPHIAHILIQRWGDLKVRKVERMRMIE